MNKSRLDDLHDRRRPYLATSIHQQATPSVGSSVTFSRSIEVIDQFRTASRNHPKSAHHFWNVHLDAKPIINKQQSGRIPIIIKNTLSFTFRPSTNNRNRHTLHKKLATVGLHLALKPNNINRSDTGTRHVLAQNPAQTTV